MNKFFLLTFILFSSLLILGFSPLQNISKVSLSMITRSTTANKTATIRAELCYLSSGKLISHFTAPEEKYIINNAKGEISIYDPIKNTVIQQVNYFYSTETTQFYYFLNNQKGDLGLRGMGFINKNTNFDKNLMISNWIAPAKLMKTIKEVELVHDGENPIFTKYVGTSGRIIKKVYYYKYSSLGSVKFPMAITQIEYLTTKDSVITKTTYSDIKLNDAVNNNLLNFTIPKNAKVIK